MMNLPQKIWRDPAYFIAFGFGSGLMPVGPGTWGTVAAIPIYFLLAQTHWSVYLSVTLVSFVLGVFVCNKVSRDLGVPDYSGIVWDEIVGFLLTMFLVPFHLIWIISGFLLFRLFDIWKPNPIKWLDHHVKGGFGIMIDDVLAAIFAWIILQALVWGLA